MTPDQTGTTREALLDAASAVLAERGAARTSIDAISKAAGVTKGAVYWHFKNKEEMLFELLDERVAAPLEALFAAVARAGRGERTALQAGAAFNAIVREQRTLLLLYHEFWAASMRDPRMRERFGAHLRVLQDHLADALAQRYENLGIRLAISAQELAIVSLGLGIGLAYARLTDESLVPDRLYGETIALISQGMAARAAA